MHGYAHLPCPAFFEAVPLAGTDRTGSMAKSNTRLRAFGPAPQMHVDQNEENECELRISTLAHMAAAHTKKKKKKNSRPLRVLLLLP